MWASARALLRCATDRAFTPFLVLSYLWPAANTEGG